MKPKLKLNHISDLHDARYCAAVGIDLLGFHVEGPKRQEISPKAVGEIVAWLSGPEAVGEFDTADPAFIQEAVATAQLKWVSLPLDYPTGQAAEIDAPLIFRGPTVAINTNGLQHVLALSTQFPDAQFEFAADPKELDVWSTFMESGLRSRTILRFVEPTGIYSLLEKQGLTPYAFSLGDFVEEPDGALDYATCDDFIERFSELTFS